MFAATTYIAENKESMNLVEGEKVYVVGKSFAVFFCSVFKRAILRTSPVVMMMIIKNMKGDGDGEFVAFTMVYTKIGRVVQMLRVVTGGWSRNI